MNFASPKLEVDSVKSLNAREALTDVICRKRQVAVDLGVPFCVWPGRSHVVGLQEAAKVN